MNLTLKHGVILALILIVGFALRTHEALKSANLPHDDQISLLAAAGKLEDYATFIRENHAAPVIRPASDWQQWLQPDTRLDFLSNARQISQELKAHDIHPPLYFIWLSLVVRQVEQITPVIGWISNAGFFLLNGLLLFALSLKILRNPAQALLATLIWSVSTAAILGSVAARHYELLTSITLISTLLLWPALQRSQLHLPSLAGYGLLVALGFLINYQFLYHLAALSLLILLAQYRRPGIVVMYGLITLLGLGLALYLYPALLQQTHEVRGWQGAITGGDIRFRLRNTAEEVAKYCVAGTLVALLVFACKREWLQQIDRRLGLLVLVNLLALAGAYLTFVSPRHAMGGRYMANLGPFLAMLFAAILTAYWQHRHYRSGIIALLLLPALWLTYKPAKSPAPPAPLNDAVLVVADFNDRGVWPGIAWHLRPDQQVLVTDLESLLATPTLYESLLATATGMILVSNPNEAPNSPQEQRHLLTLLDQQAAVDTIYEQDRVLDYFRISPDHPGG